MKPVHTREGDKCHRSQSEVIGVLLLTAVVLLTMSVVGAGLIGNSMANVDEGPLVDIDVNATTQWVEITHTGGDTVATGDVAIVLQADGTERHPLSSYTLEEGSDNATFRSGDVWQRDHALDGDRMRVLAVHEPSNTVLDRETVPITVTIAARFSYSPSSPTSTESVSFDASESSVAGSSITSYEWDLDDDGITDATGETTSHTFGDDGSYPVTLTITADDGRTANRTRTISVLNEAPSPSFTYSPSSPDTGEQIDFDATGSSDSDGTIQSYAWDFDDGTTGSGDTVTHSYSNTGTYTVELTVTDDDGSSRSTVQTITVAPEYFDVSIVSTNSPVTEGDTLSVDANVTNTGNSQGTQDITLDINGTEEDRQSVTLASGASTTITLNWSTAVGDAQSNAYVANVSSENTSDETEVNVVEAQAVLQINDVRGLTNQTVGHDYQADVDIEETNDVLTQNLTVKLVVTDSSGTEVFNVTNASIGELRNNTTTAQFDVGRLGVDSYSYTVTANADNAGTVTSSGSFTVLGSFNSVTASNLTENSDSETQNLTFGLQGDLADGESVTIDLSEAQDLGSGKGNTQVDYSNAQPSVVTGSGDTQFTTNNSTHAILTYAPGPSGDSDGSTIEIQIQSIETGTQQNDPYNVTFDRSDGRTATTNFSV